MQEITLIYPQLHPPELNAQASNRVCNALALFQCVASHQETRELFLQAQIPLFLYPFLNTTSKTRPFEYLRLTALGVIGALVKQDDSTVRDPHANGAVRHFYIVAASSTTRLRVYRARVGKLQLATVPVQRDSSGRQPCSTLGCATADTAFTLWRRHPAVGTSYTRLASNASNLPRFGGALKPKQQAPRRGHAHQPAL